MAPRGRRPLDVRFAPFAAADLDEAFAYVDARNKTAAEELLGRLRESVERLADFPDTGVTLSPEDYEFVAPGIRFIAVDPYVVFYRVRDHDVVVLRILHSRRDALDELMR